MGDDKKGKKKKKSKAQLQAELEEQQEEMRLAEEAELKRQEAVELRRREEERTRAAEREAEAEAETMRLADEIERQAGDEQARAKAVRRARWADQEGREWDEYVRCNDLPNPREISDLNAHLTLWKDEDAELDRTWQTQPASALVRRVVDGCGTTERILDLLDTVAGEAAEVNDAETTGWVADYTATLRGMSRDKVDALTRWLLQRADEYERVVDADAPAADSETTAGASSSEIAPASAAGDDDDLKREVLESRRAFGVGYGLWVHTSTAHFRRKAVRFPSIGVTVEAPKSVAMLKVPLALRVVQRSYDDVAALGTSSPYVSVGGVLTVEQLAVPPGPKRAKGWKMREQGEQAGEVQVVPYLAGAGASNAQPQPFRISYEVPASVFLPSKRPKVGWYDAARGRWREEGVADVRFDHRTRVLSMSTVNLAPLAVIQPRALDFPYRRWSFTPLDSSSAELSLVGSRFEVRIRVEGGLCRLVRPASSQLAHLTGELVSPGRLVQRLARSGINVAPGDADAVFSRKPVKTAAVEERMHDAVSRLVPAFEVRGSMWNHSRARDTCAVQICPAAPRAAQEGAAPEEAKMAEHKSGGDTKKGGGHADDADDAGADAEDQLLDSADDGWTTLCGDESRFFVAQASSTAAPDGPQEGRHTHASVRLALGEHYEQEGGGFAAEKELQKAASDSLGFQIATRSLLNLVRPFTFH